MGRKAAVPRGTVEEETIYRKYLQAGDAVGTVLWNVFGELASARLYRMFGLLG